jgi:CDP-4-dehydro-6-deoxyglucose reductase
VSGLDIVFLATGTGIAPVKAMLETLFEVDAEQQPRSVTVLWGGRTEDDLYLDMSSIPGNFNFVPVLSRPNEKWTGASGYVQQVLLAVMPDLRNAAVYACGSEAMIQSAKTALIQAQLPSNRFYSDAFVCSASF